MTLPADPAPAGLTDMDIDVLTAPLDIPLWPNAQPSKVTLRSVALVRTASSTYVRWTYRDDHSALYEVGQRVGIRVNLNDLHTAR